MVDLRKVLIIFVIAVLFSVFVVTSIDAFYPEPKYEDICSSFGGPRPVVAPDFGIKQNCTQKIPPTILKNCQEQKGFIDYKNFDEQGCQIEPYCNTCDQTFRKQQERYNLIYFIISAIAGLIAITLGVYLPSGKNPLHEWIGTGFMLGGLFILFFGTVRTFGDIHRFVRPVIILAELLVIIWLSYKKLSDGKNRQDD